MLFAPFFACLLAKVASCFYPFSQAAIFKVLARSNSGNSAYIFVNSTKRPEAELVLCCARAEAADVTSRIQTILEGCLDWTLVADLAQRHRVTPLVYRQLSRVAPRLLSMPALQQLVWRFSSIARRNLLLTKELLVCLDLFRKNDIPVISFKGPLLAVSAFGGLCWREFGDLDLLLRPRDITEARRLLESRGYRPEIKMDDAKEAAYLRSEHAFQYIRDEDQLVVELHWRLSDNYLQFPFDTEQVWSSACSRELFGNPVESLSPEVLFLYLCMHGAKHFWDRLEWIACLPAVIRANPNLQWPVIKSRAQSVGGLRILHLGLLLANELDPSDITKAPLAMFQRDPIAEELASTVWSTMFRDELDSSSLEVYRFRFYIKARERLWDRLNIVQSSTIRIPHPESDILDRVPLPDSLLFLHYVLGPIRRLRRYGLRGLAGILNPKHIPLSSCPPEGNVE